MKQKEGFVLKTIEGVPYLLPYGQNIADHKRGVSLNETGAFIWNALKEPQSKADLLKTLATHYKASDCERASLEKDLDTFLLTLSAYGALDMEKPNITFSPELVQYVSIGGLTLKLQGPKDAFSKDFLPFLISEDITKEDPGKFSKEISVDLTVNVHMGMAPTMENGRLLLRNKELYVCERTKDYLLLLPMAKQILEAHLQKKGSQVDFYCMPPVNDTLVYDLFHGIRFAFLYLAQQKGFFAIHSASILYKDRLWIFSGPSGMGKSTHTNLWKQIYDTPIVNGDLNLLAMTSNGPIVYGMPWCGTSGISDTNSYPLGGIIFLGRSNENIVEELSPDKKALLLMQRLISPAWTPNMLTKNLDFSTALAKKAELCRLKCSKDSSAVELMKQWIDDKHHYTKL